MKADKLIDQKTQLCQLVKKWVIQILTEQPVSSVLRILTLQRTELRRWRS